jgi:hypothetical protein
LIRGAGSVINPYDFTFKRDSKCQAKGLSATKVMALKPEIIDQLIENNKYFK